VSQRAQRILVVQGHPDPRPGRLCRALAEAYADAAREAGHQLRVVDVATLDFPLLRSKDEFEHGAVPDTLREAQEAIAWAGHLVIVYPLWLGDMPALLKGFLEQVFRPGFAVGAARGDDRAGGLLAGRSARVVVTMGMPAPVYRWFFGAHSLKSLTRNILRFSGIGPVRTSLFGMVEAGGAQRRARWLARMADLGRRAA